MYIIEHIENYFPFLKMNLRTIEPDLSILRDHLVNPDVVLLRTFEIGLFRAKIEIDCCTLIFLKNVCIRKMQG